MNRYEYSDIYNLERQNWLGDRSNEQLIMHVLSKLLLELPHLRDDRPTAAALADELLDRSRRNVNDDQPNQ